MSCSFQLVSKFRYLDGEQFRKPCVFVNYKTVLVAIRTFVYNSWRMMWYPLLFERSVHLYISKCFCNYDQYGYMVHIELC